MTDGQVRPWNPEWPRHAARWRKPAIVGVSLGLHVMVLGLIGLRTINPGEPPPAERVVYLELEPRRPADGGHIRTRDRSAPERQTPSPPVSGGAPMQPATATREPSAFPALSGVDAPTTAPTTMAGTAGVPIEDPWRVRPGVMTSPRGVCPPAPGNRRGRRLCAAGPDLEPEPETYAEVAPSRRAPADRRREEGFDEQARANEAWREYTRGEGDYPGLRSLLRHR